MKKKLSVVLMAVVALLLGSCENANTTSTGNTSSGTIQPSTSVEPSVQPSSPQESVSIAPTEYLVIIQSSSGVTIESDVTTAQRGATVTLTVTNIAEGFNLNQVLVNGRAISPTTDNGNVYIFTMPNIDVIVTTSVSVTGDVVLAGDVAAVFQLDESGVYVAKDVVVTNDSVVKVEVGQGSAKTTYSYVNIDRTKSFADIEYRYQSGAGNDAANIELGGNAKYDIYYNPDAGDRCLYFVRTEVLGDITTTNQFASLMTGYVQSEQAVYPANVNKVTYTNTVSGDDYTWNLYENNVSFAQVKTLGTNNVKAVVYKALGDDIYTVVDNYVEGTYDQTKRDDSSAFSAKYKVVNEYTSGMSRYQYLKNEAIFDANLYSHSTISIDFDLHYAYRTGFSGNDYLKGSKIDVATTKHADGSFTTTIDSYKTEVDDSDASTNKHTEYSISVTFTKAGAILSGTYSETAYDSTAYDFTNDKFLTGGEQLGRVAKEVTFAYEYGEALAGAPEFDPSIYFISEITNVEVYNTSTNTTNSLSQYDNIEYNIPTSTHVRKFEYTPQTALDIWQYAVVASSNPAVIGPNSNQPSVYTAHTLGTADITFGNHTTNDVIKVVTVNVVNNVKIRGFYMTSLDGDYDNIMAARANINAGYSIDVRLNVSPSNAPFDATVTSLDTTLLDVSLNGTTLTLDATKAANIIVDTNVTVRVESPLMDPGLTKQYEEFIITIKPQAISSVVGTWTATSPAATLTLTNEVHSELNGVTYSKGEVKVGGRTGTFGYSYNPATGAFRIRTDELFDTIIIKYDNDLQQLGVIYFFEDYTDKQEYLGYVDEDGGGDEVDREYVYFTQTA